MAKKPTKTRPTAKKPARATKAPTPPAKAKRAAPKPDKAKSKPDRVIDGDDEFAKHIGKSTRTVQTWRKKGMPFETLGPNKYRYHLDQTDPWVQANGKADEDDDERRKLRLDREKAKLRADIAKAQRIEREEQEAQGNILPRDIWEAFAIEVIHITRGQFLELPKQARRHCCSKCSKSVPAELEKLVNKILHKIAAIKNGPPKDERSK